MPKNQISEHQRNWCLSILGYLLNWKLTVYFRKPIDLNSEEFKGYLDVVKKPIDLETLQIKFQNGEYSSAKSFISDLNLIFQNAKTFYGPDTVMTMIADEILMYTKSQEKFLDMSASDIWLYHLKEIQKKVENHMKDIPPELKD